MEAKTMEHEEARPAALAADFLITPEQAYAHAGLSKSEVCRKQKAGAFPAAIRMGSRCTRYSLREVLAWVEARKSERATQKPYPPIRRAKASQPEPMTA